MQKQILLGILLAVLIAPGPVVAQAPVPPAPMCETAVQPVSDALKQTSEKLTEVIDQVGTIETRVTEYYTANEALQPLGTAGGYPTLKAAVTKTEQTALTEVSQLNSLQLRCTPNPAASVSRLNLEVSQAVAAVRAYRSAVRTELLAIRTWAEQVQSATPSPTVAPEPPRLR